ncbi:glutathione S-transferase [Litoreibacter ponti]|uniref:Glutathione S-transferase n=1 Tax=Litoreibacter ponti TaxID=1510457 RepID=A0A2T6BDF9_9RHOB|nr:glutathione S-transferase family protein [Litoreibacter ponti]PTX54084.1 glutathione S-transferase [Litoreibacter ponti]
MLYGRATSSNVQAVLWALEEMGLDYTRLDYGEGFAPLDTPDYLALNPHGLIPVLREGDVAIWESCAILRYLAARHGGDAFWPADPLARAQVDMWAEWAKRDVAEGFTGPVFWQVVRTPKARWDHAAIAQAVATLEMHLAKAEARLAHQDYLCGDSLTLADIVFGHVLYRYFDIEIDRAPLPHLRRYADRLAERPAYRHCVMVSYETLRDTI